MMSQETGKKLHLARVLSARQVSDNLRAETRRSRSFWLKNNSKPESPSVIDLR